MWTLKLLNDYKRLSKIEEFIRRAKLQNRSNTLSPHKEPFTVDKDGKKHYNEYEQDTKPPMVSTSVKPLTKYYVDRDFQQTSTEESVTGNEGNESIEEENTPKESSRQ